MAAIAAAKRIQPSTVESYLGEAIAGGRAYCWSRFSVPAAALAAVESAAAAVLCAAPQHAAGPAADSEAGGGPKGGVAAGQLGRSGAWATGVFADDSDDDEALSLAAATADPSAACPTALPPPAAAGGGLVSAGGAAAAAPKAGNDLVARLSAAGVGTKAVRESLPVELDFGKIRLALAHLGRTASRFFEG